MLEHLYFLFELLLFVFADLQLSCEGMIDGILSLSNMMMDAGCSLTEDYVDKLAGNQRADIPFEFGCDDVVSSMQNVVGFVEGLALGSLLRDPNHAHHEKLMNDHTRPIVEKLDTHKQDLKCMLSILQSMLPLAEKFSSTVEEDCNRVYLLHADIAKWFQVALLHADCSFSKNCILVVLGLSGLTIVGGVRFRGLRIQYRNSIVIPCITYSHRRCPHLLQKHWLTPKRSSTPISLALLQLRGLSSLSPPH